MKKDRKSKSKAIGFLNITVVLATAICVVFLGFGAQAQTWQETLEGNFDIVETFDQLQDWKGSKGSESGGAVSIEDYPDEFPVRYDGSKSIWQYYSSWNDPADRDLFWIANHGADNVWRQEGKSMCIDYGKSYDDTIRGPGRMSFKIGDSPDDGYKDEIHIFFMSRWFKDFYIVDETSFKYHLYLKTLDVSSGFRNVRNWGTIEEHDYVESHGGSTQALHEYGVNAQVYNYQAFSGEKMIKNTILTTNDTNNGYSAETDILFDTNGIGIQTWDDEWFGLEYRIKTSNPHGEDNGEFEFWVYAEDGSLISHELATGFVNFRDGNSIFDHAWNKFVWGGNRCMCLTSDACFNGTHNGPDNSGVMIDTAANINTSIGSEIYNIDKNEHGTIVEFTSTSVTATKVGGGEFDWDIGDRYYIVVKNNFSPLIDYFYFDDVIVDDQRIGPTYFALLNETPLELNITTTSLQNGTTNTAYSQTLSAQGGTSPYTWSIISGSLPANLNLNSSTGEISGTPAATGTSNFTVQATDSVSATDTQGLSITISDSDTTPPTRSNPSPTGTLSAGTTNTAISLTTNESATCRYSTIPNTAYSSMTNTFTTTGGSSHSTVVTGLEDGQTYTYYVRAEDTTGNANTDDFVISFSVATQGSGDSGDDGGDDSSGGGCFIGTAAVGE